MRALIVLVLAVGMSTSSPAALASCAIPPGGVQEQLATAEAVFVGTVIATPVDDRLAEVAVEEVWRGDVGGMVEVAGSELAGDPGGATSVDRQYRAGARYLFAVTGSGNRFTDSICSPTRLWEPDLEQYRPEGAEVVAEHPPGNDSGSSVGADDTDPRPTTRRPWLVGAVVLAALTALGAGVVRRSRPNPGEKSSVHPYRTDRA